MSRSLLLLPLLLVPTLPLASGGRQAPGAAGNKGFTPTARPEQVPAGFHQIKLNGHTFTLPVGFTIELAAGPPLADRPIVASLDEKGRLYICDSSGSNAKVVEQVKTKPHRIVRLEDTDGDGKYDKQTVFVAHVTFPEGAMWKDGSLYVAAPPHIWKFTDTDGDGKADKEEIWHDGKTLTGCANDLHGPYAGPDGYIYWCKGAFAQQDYTLPNGKPFTTRASHIFRARPDHSGLEPVMTGGMDNPVDVVFTPTGERIFSTTFFQHPRDGKRDGLIHAVYGGVYGKDHDPVHHHPWTSPQLMPPMTHMGPAAPCGLHRYESDQFGTEYANNIFCTQFNMHKVSRHVLVSSGSTYVTKDSDFVVSDNLDFHPTDVIEDADGSLLVMDTGGWYKLCCPTSQLVKPDITGAVYRVKRVGAHKVADPRGLTIEWAKLEPADVAKRFRDPRPVVRWKAVAALARNTAENREWIRFAIQQGPETARLHAIWAAARLPDSGIGLALFDEATRLGQSDQVRVAAAHVLSLHRDQTLGRDLTLWLLAEGSPAVRRSLAEAVGRIGDPKAVPTIFGALADEKNDRVVDHSLTYALIEIGNSTETAKGLTHRSPRVRRAALTALDQMANGSPDPKAVLAELDAKDTALKDTAWWIAGRHPEWGEHLVGYFQSQFRQAEKLTPEAQAELADRLAKFAKTETVQKLLGDTLAGPASDTGSRLVLTAMTRSGLKAFPDVWVKGVARVLRSGNLDVVRGAVGLIRTIPVSKSQYLALTTSGSPTLAQIRSQNWPPALDLGLLATQPRGIGIGDESFKFTLKHLARAQPADVRAAAADVMARVDLQQDQLVALAAAFKTLGPLEIPRVLPAFAQVKQAGVGLALVKALLDPAVRAAVRTEQVKPILDKYPQAVRSEAEKLYAALAEARKDESAKLERLLREMPAGDIRRGQLVFNNAKVQCTACHKVGYVGGLVGPDLTRIGRIRTERDLLESIVFPSASFVRSYEPVRIVTVDGRTFSGVVKNDAPDEIILVVAADKEERIARADIETIAPATVSVMPAGLDQQLTPQDLADLVAFLKACQ